MDLRGCVYLLIIQCLPSSDVEGRVGRTQEAEGMMRSGRKSSAQVCGSEAIGLRNRQSELIFGNCGAVCPQSHLLCNVEDILL